MRCASPPTLRRFVAKKIVTVSKPGLIPVSFVEILDPATGQPHEDVPRLLRECALPDVKEWREKTESYASSVIPLGRIDDGALAQGVPNSPYANYQTSSAPSSAPFQAQQQRAMDDQYRSQGQQQHQRQPSSQQYPPQHQHQRGPSVSQQQQPSRQHASQPSMSRSVQSDPSEGMLPPGTFSSACVVSFHQEKVDGQQEYFFRIHAVFLPDDPAEKASRLILFRTYDHFYRFQIDLLDTFPAEAGRVDPDNPSAPPPRRILPYMPGPLDEVDDSITHERRSELDGYIRFLIALHRIKADYVLSSSLVRTFFFAGQSDGNSPIAREVAERELAAERAQDPLVDLEEGIEGMGLGGSEEGGSSQHHDHPAASSSSRQQQQQPQQQQRLSRSSASGGQPSSSAHQRGPSHSTHSLAQSNGSSHTHGGGRNTSPLPPIDTTNIRRTPYSASNGLSGGSRPPSHDYLPSATATSSSWGSNAGGGVLNSGFSPMTPAPLAATSSGSAHGGGGGQSHGSGPTAAYKKIKIYDSTTDDVMAIRVPPNVTFDQLSQKVQDRLGGGRRVLSFRDSVGSGKGASRGIEDDRDLLDWMSRTDKLVLCVGLPRSLFPVARLRSLTLDLAPLSPQVRRLRRRSCTNLGRHLVRASQPSCAPGRARRFASPDHSPTAPRAAAPSSARSTPPARALQLPCTSLARTPYILRLLGLARPPPCPPASVRLHSSLLPSLSSHSLLDFEGCACINGDIISQAQRFVVRARKIGRAGSKGRDDSGRFEAGLAGWSWFGLGLPAGVMRVPPQPVRPDQSPLKTTLNQLAALLPDTQIPPSLPHPPPHIHPPPHPWPTFSSPSCRRRRCPQPSRSVLTHLPPLRELSKPLNLPFHLPVSPTSSPSRTTRRRSTRSTSRSRCSLVRRAPASLPAELHELTSLPPSVLFHLPPSPLFHRPQPVAQRQRRR